MTTEMATLTGAYAMNALAEPERAEFDRHLAECEDCAQEVRELQETAARLGMATATNPPEELKQRVLSEIAGVRQEPPHPQDGRPTTTGEEPTPLRRSRAHWGTRLATAAAVLGVALAGAFGALAWRTQQELDQARQRIEQTGERGVAMGELLRAPDAHIITANSNGMRATTVMSDKLDRAMFMSTGIEQPPGGKTYQVWFIGDDGAVSAGLIKQDQAGRMNPIMAPIPSGTSAMGVTLEPAGGSQHPTSKPVLTMKLPA